MANGETYEEFVAKFRRSKAKTTDDCITPKTVYDGVLSYVRDRYKIGDAPIVRPFYPGGDYEAYDYPAGCVVVDNPPFSILKKIVRFYQERCIRFFIFCDSRFCLGYLDIPGVSIVFCKADITYDNGAVVSTAFCSNLSPDVAIEIDPDMRGYLNLPVNPPPIVRRKTDRHIFRSVDISNVARGVENVSVPASAVRIIDMGQLYGPYVAVRSDYAEILRSVKTKREETDIIVPHTPAAQRAIEELDAQLEGRGNA